jgi:hypothetical protein
MSRKPKKRKTRGKQAPPGMTLNLDELAGIVDKVAPALGEEDSGKLKCAIDTLAFLKAEWQAQGHSIKRLLAMLFGERTEKTSRVLEAGKSAEATAPSASTNEAPSTPGASQMRKGHGRNGVAALTGAERVKIAHTTLAAADRCPDPMCEGKVYPMADPKLLVRFTGAAPISASVYECARLRCNLCEEIFTAAAPEGVGDKKYDESAAAMIAMLRLGVGLPHPRIEKLQAGFGIPLASSTQWDILADAADVAEPAFFELIRQSAQGSLFFQDDTWMRILKMTPEQRAAALGEEASEARTGVFSTGIVSIRESVRIALFFTGPRHAGENFEQLLKRRATELPPPIQMCDASANNTAGVFETILANCNAHCRRLFVEIAESFPTEVRFVLESFREVYKIDAQAREQSLSPQERLRLHQEKSAPWMKGLKNWVRRHLQDGRIEENSALGSAAHYLQEHWGALSLFLRVEGAPLDNSLCERALKRMIIYRKNSMFYRTLNGARVGDIFTSLIYTAELNGVNAFEYLTTVLQNATAIRSHPQAWMPWTYQQTLAQRGSAA